MYAIRSYYVAAGIGYMLLAGRHLIPIRKSGVLTEEYQVKEYITEVQILSYNFV